MSVHSHQLSSVSLGDWTSIVAMLVTVILMANAILCHEASHALGMARFPKDRNTSQLSSKTWRIINGHEVKRGQFPFLVSIDDKCAGAIISPQHILTSANCVTNYISNEPGLLVTPLNMMRVFIGEHNRLLIDGERRVDIRSLKLHPDYMEDTKQHNIAILKTTPRMFSSFAGKDSVGSIQLRYKPIEAGQPMSVAGWGATSVADHAGNPVPTQLDVRKLDQDSCKWILGKAEIELPNGSLCAEPHEAGAVCHGDEGAPLFLQNQRNDLELAGLASHFKIEPCSDGKLPAVYTDVPEHIDWILANLN